MGNATEHTVLSIRVKLIGIKLPRIDRFRFPDLVQRCVENLKSGIAIRRIIAWTENVAASFVLSTREQTFSVVKFAPFRLDCGDGALSPEAI